MPALADGSKIVAKGNTVKHFGHLLFIQVAFAVWNNIVMQILPWGCEDSKMNIAAGFCGEAG